MESLKLYSTIVDLDLSLRKEKPIINDNLTLTEKAHHEKWIHLNKCA